MLPYLWDLLIFAKFQNDATLKINFEMLRKWNSEGAPLRSSPAEVLFWKVVLQKSNNLTREHLRWSVISIKLQSNSIETSQRAPSWMLQQS